MNDIDAWVWWLVGAAALGIPLVVTAMPEFGMLAVGAVAAAVVSGLGFDTVIQVLASSSSPSPSSQWSGPSRPGTADSAPNSPPEWTR